MESVLVLIAAPGSAVINDALASRLNDGRWLARGEALECDAALEPVARKLCAGLPIDINIVPLTNRRKRILLADMDSTMIQQECIDELAVVAGVGQLVKDITARSMRGELDFEGALKERVGLLKGLPAQVIATLIKDKISFMPGGATLLATMKANGAYTALVSGGFTAFTTHVAGTLGFHEHHANTLLIDADQLTGEVAMPILGKDAKVAALQRICREKSLSPADVLAVGDGANDIPMLQASGMGVALHAKPRVQEQARCVINHGDLTALLYLQGYTQDEFAPA